MSAQPRQDRRPAAGGVQARAVGLRTVPTPHNVRYLRTKRDVLGHDLAGEPTPATVG